MKSEPKLFSQNVTETIPWQKYDSNKIDFNFSFRNVCFHSFCESLNIFRLFLLNGKSTICESERKMKKCQKQGMKSDKKRVKMAHCDFYFFFGKTNELSQHCSKEKLFIVIHITTLTSPLYIFHESNKTLKAIPMKNLVT